MRLLPNTVKYKHHNCTVGISSYESDPQNKAIVFTDAVDGGPVAAITKNFPGQLGPNEVAIDTNNCGDTAVEVLVAAGIIGQEVLKWISSGFCRYPVHKLLV